MKKVDIRYEEKFKKNNEVSVEQITEVLKANKADIVTMEKRGTCLISKDEHEFMQITFYFKKD